MPAFASQSSTEHRGFRPRRGRRRQLVAPSSCSAPRRPGARGLVDTGQRSSVRATPSGTATISAPPLAAGCGATTSHERRRDLSFAAELPPRSSRAALVDTEVRAPLRRRHRDRRRAADLRGERRRRFVFLGRGRTAGRKEALSCGGRRWRARRVARRLRRGGRRTRRRGDARRDRSRMRRPPTTGRRNGTSAETQRRPPAPRPSARRGTCKELTGAKLFVLFRACGLPRHSSTGVLVSPDRAVGQGGS